MLFAPLLSDTGSYYASGVLESQNEYTTYFTAGFLARSWAVHVRSGRHPKQENDEIGGFGVGRPDFGGRWPRGALGKRKARGPQTPACRRVNKTTGLASHGNGRPTEIRITILYPRVGTALLLKSTFKVRIWRRNQLRTKDYALTKTFSLQHKHA